MGHSALSKAWSEDRAVLGPWITTDSEWVAETLAHSGYDFLVVDCQHSLLDEVAAGHLLKALAGAPAACFVRCSRNEPARIGRVLDAGADGVIVPLVNSAAEAADAVAACRYGSKGTRSFGPFRAGLGFDVAKLEGRVSCFVMIETVRATERAAEICAVPGVAGVFIGPTDLGVDKGIPAIATFGENAPAPLAEAMDKVLKATKAAGIICGRPAYSVADAGRAIKAGFRLVTIGADRMMLRERAAQIVEEVRAAAK
jgi:2-keto-3-deoxy-L-rhamnonate aldolase RhmA